jgi:thiol:disulfide interchange protein DsbD
VAVKLGYTKVYRDPLGFPEWEAQGLPVKKSPAGLAQAEAEDFAPGTIQGWAMLWTLLGIFAGGVALNLTPCVYPLIPITASYFGGRSGEGKGSIFGHGVCYIGGLAVTNSTLGVTAALTGGMMGAMLQHPAVLIGVGTVLVFFALSLFGFWELKLPGGLTRASSRSYGGYLGSLFMGLTLGVVAAPCIGPFVLGLLTWVAGMGSALMGFLVFFTLSLGLGLPLFVLAVFSGKLDRLPRSGEWMVWVRKLMGWVLVGMAAYFVRPLLPESLGVGLLATVILAAGLHLGWVDRSAAGVGTFRWIKKGVGLSGVLAAALIAGAWLVRGPGVSWESYSSDLLAEARNRGTPAILDFSATWCTPCRQLDDETFHDPEVVALAEKAFLMVKVDLTRSGNVLHERLVEKYGVKGVPTVVFLDSRGEERPELRMMDFLPPAQLLQRMEAAGQGLADRPFGQQQ